MPITREIVGATLFVARIRVRNGLGFGRSVDHKGRPYGLVGMTPKRVG